MGLSHEIIQKNSIWTAYTGHNFQIRFICRGHQHNGLMLENMVNNHGIYGLWSEIQWNGVNGTQIPLIHASPVWVMNVSPCTSYGKDNGYNFDTYTLLDMNGPYQNWHLQPHKLII